MGLENISLASVMANAQALAMVIVDVTTGDCAECQCGVCVSMRGIGQAAVSALREP